MKTDLCLLSIIAVLLTSCNQGKRPIDNSTESIFSTESVNSTKRWLERVSTEFDIDNQLIIDKQVCSYDLKLSIHPAFFNDANRDVHGVNYALNFYNYGSDIKLCDNLIDDAFIDVYTSVNVLYHLKLTDNITILKRDTNAKYGDWAIVKITSGNTVTGEIFMTPLALKAYNNDRKDDLIYIQFYAAKNNKGMNVLFNADDMVSFVVDNHQSTIIRNSLTSPDEGEGRFWFTATRR